MSAALALAGLGAIGLIVREARLHRGLRLGEIPIGADRFARIAACSATPEEDDEVPRAAGQQLLVGRGPGGLRAGSVPGPQLVAGAAGADLGPALHLSPQALSLSFGHVQCGLCAGTVLAIQLAVHFPQRRLLVSYAAIFTLGSLMSATAFTPGLFIAGHVLQGLFTSMMLIAAAPALVLGWPTKRLPTTAIVMNIGIFGAVAAGPVIGGL